MHLAYNSIVIQKNSVVYSNTVRHILFQVVDEINECRVIFEVLVSVRCSFISYFIISLIDVID